MTKYWKQPSVINRELDEHAIAHSYNRVPSKRKKKGIKTYITMALPSGYSVKCKKQGGENI